MWDSIGVEYELSSIEETQRLIRIYEKDFYLNRLGPRLDDWGMMLTCNRIPIHELMAVEVDKDEGV